MHTPICIVCGAWEVGTFTASTTVCSTYCQDELDIADIEEND